MTNIRAPYNFVPLSDKVFFPKWADQISHDIPFSDGVSGEIELEIEAKTPVFVRNGHTPNDKAEQNEQFLNFSNFDGKFFIPATSLKGSIRNILEIISFSKMDRVANNRYSIRDLYLKKYMNFFQENEVHCGWMCINKENTVEITDHGEPFRISHTDLDIKYGTVFSKKFKDSSLLKNDVNRTALFKINLFGSNNPHGKFNELPLNSDNSVDKRKKVVFDQNGEIEGTIIFTGQSSVRRDKGDKVFRKGREIVVNKGEGKAYEFVFNNKAQKLFSIDLSIENNLFDDFLFIYKDSYDWKNHWKKRFYKGEKVPVFMSIDKNKGLQHFGLSYLYKLPFPSRVKEYLPDAHNDDKFDLSECIFGTTKTKEAIKGRVAFSHANLTHGGPMESILAPYMASPKPTYYPIYLQQRGRDGYPMAEFKTMLDKDARLKGWKRYPIKEVLDFKIPEKINNENLSPFVPVKKGSKFSSKIRFHNLRESELGALLYSIQVDEEFIHSIGFAKPYGYGQILIKVNKLSITNNVEKRSNDYINSFRQLIRQEISNYDNQPQIRELITMGTYQETIVPLEYMELKEFVEKKKQKRSRYDKNVFDIPGEYLEYYTNLINSKNPVNEEIKILKAEITFFKKPLLKAVLIDHKITNSMVVEEFPKKHKFKVGEIIEVESIGKGGNIIKLKFIRKV